MNEVENEDLVFTLETIVDKFGEEMSPYALGFCQTMASEFWKCMSTAEANDEGDDPGALAVVGCLRAISTILESISRLPRLFVHIEPTLLPIMRRMLTTDGQGWIEPRFYQRFTEINPSLWSEFYHIICPYCEGFSEEQCWLLLLLLSHLILVYLVCCYIMRR